MSEKGGVYPPSPPTVKNNNPPGPVRPTSEGSGSRRQSVGNNDPVRSGDGSLESSARAGCGGGEGALCFTTLLKPQEPRYLNRYLNRLIWVSDRLATRGRQVRQVRSSQPTRSSHFWCCTMAHGCNDRGERVIMGLILHTTAYRNVVFYRCLSGSNASIYAAPARGTRSMNYPTVAV